MNTTIIDGIEYYLIPTESIGMLLLGAVIVGALGYCALKIAGVFVSYKLRGRLPPPS